MITAGVVIAEDPEFGMNAGMYRMMLKERNITGIDIVTPNNLRKFAERALHKRSRCRFLFLSARIRTNWLLRLSKPIWE